MSKAIRYYRTFQCRSCALLLKKSRILARIVYFQWHLGFFAKEYTPTFRGFESHFGFYNGKEDYWDHSFVERAVNNNVRNTHPPTHTHYWGWTCIDSCLYFTDTDLGGWTCVDSSLYFTDTDLGVGPVSIVPCILHTQTWGLNSCW